MMSAILPTMIAHIPQGEYPSLLASPVLLAPCFVVVAGTLSLSVCEDRMTQHDRRCRGRLL